MIAESKQYQIKQKPSLFLQSVKAQGYQVIEYQPNGEVQVFSVGCLPNCQLISPSNKQTCLQCHNPINLYSDSTMLSFNGRVRIDLINKRFVYLPVCMNQWQDLKISDSQKISHLKYSSMLSAAVSCEQKQMMTNYYHYQILPTPSPRSFWSLTQQSTSKCFSILKDNSSNEKIYLLIGDESVYCLKVPNNQLINSCALQMNFVALILNNGESYILLVYEIGNCQCQQINPHLCVKLSQSNNSDKSYCLEFVNQAIAIYQIDRTNKGIKQINIDNVMFQQPNIDLRQLSGFLVNRQHSVYLFKSANSSKCNIMTINSQTIEILDENKEVKCKRQNLYGLKQIMGHYTVKQKNKIYLYSFQPQSIIICTYEQNINKLTTIIIDQSTSIGKQIQLINLNTQNKQIIMKTMQIEGCFATYHTIDKNKRVVANRICTL